MLDAEPFGPHRHIGHRPEDGLKYEGGIKGTAALDGETIGGGGRWRKAEAVPRLPCEGSVGRRSLPLKGIARGVAHKGAEDAVTVVLAVGF